MLLPLWVLIERRSPAPMLDLKIFRNRLFAAASAAAFINGLARFALMFLFVFYYQGAQGNTPITAGIKLIPLALGMLIASPIAASTPTATAPAPGRDRDVRQRDRTGRDDDAPGAHPLLAERPVALIVGVGSGMFNSPNTAAMMGTVPAHRRGVAAGARTLLQNTGAVLSIAFVLAIVTSAVPKATLFAVFSGVTKGSPSEARPLHRQHARRAVGARGTSLLGAVVCLLRPARPSLEAATLSFEEQAAQAPRARRARRRPTLRPGRDAPRRTMSAPGARAGSERREQRARACASATSPGWPARPRARSATTRRSACCPRRPRAPPARTGSTARPRSSACAR